MYEVLFWSKFSHVDFVQFCVLSAFFFFFNERE